MSVVHDVVELGDPQVTVSVYAVVDNVTIPGSSFVFTLVAPDITAAVRKPVGRPIL